MCRPSETICTHRRFICCGRGWHQMMSVCMFARAGGEMRVGGGEEGGTNQPKPPPPVGRVGSVSA